MRLAADELHVHVRHQPAQQRLRRRRRAAAYQAVHLLQADVGALGADLLRHIPVLILKLRGEARFQAVAQFPVLLRQVVVVVLLLEHQLLVHGLLRGEERRQHVLRDDVSAAVVAQVEHQLLDARRLELAGRLHQLLDGMEVETGIGQVAHLLAAELVDGVAEDGVLVHRPGGQLHTFAQGVDGVGGGLVAAQVHLQRGGIVEVGVVLRRQVSPVQADDDVASVQPRLGRRRTGVDKVDGRHALVTVLGKQIHRQIPAEGGRHALHAAGEGVHVVGQHGPLVDEFLPLVVADAVHRPDGVRVGLDVPRVEVGADLVTPVVERAHHVLAEHVGIIDFFGHLLRFRTTARLFAGILVGTACKDAASQQEGQHHAE